ncbi:RHS repeat-associated core domain-containing protein [Stenotrophomonas sp. ZAC14A_NAIMI4_1]|uniref:RHS repeat-associated core domain-containing protein n=1 Tax=Stenotrophomonas sp. ZAC14A_NAIMI4_1 TaxID=2072412 RepID=UPI0020B13918|nr:RHS repeat-associated core domain-containing protein [Stenotrophomonas sp. ZAC14A_NAIMI4_1]
MSTRFRGFEDRFRKSGAFCTWLCCVLLIGLGLSPAVVAQTTVTYIHTDALGSVVAESDANGNVIKRYDYEPYGAVVGGQVTDGPGYTGHVSDSATGLSYMQQRYMDPQLGVFLSVDPVTAYEQPVGQFNRYRYANGNPYKFKDPDGHSATLVAPIVLVPIIIATGYYATTTPQQREKAGEALIRGIKGLFQKSESNNSSGGEGGGVRQLGDLEPIHDPNHSQNDPAIGKLSDKELGDAINNPKNGDEVTVRGNRVLDGNTRINEAKARGWSDSTKIPVRELDDSPINVDDDPLGPYRGL